MLFFNIQESDLRTFTNPMRCVSDHIMMVSKFVLMSQFAHRTDVLPSSPSISIEENGRHRMNIHSVNKTCSVIFPFSMIETEDSELKYTFGPFNVISSTINSALANVSYQIKQNSADSFSSILDIIYENDILGCEQDIELLSQIVFWFYKEESGHVRYDHDLKNSNGTIHPEHHLDINYRNQNSFKIGLRSELEHQSFYDLFAKSKPCHYLHIE